MESIMSKEKNGQIKKEDLDQYFTPEEDANRYTKRVVEIYGTNVMYIEPTAGDGVFINALILAGVPKENIKAYDLDPKRESVSGVQIEKMDVFKLNGLEYPIFDSIVIGNPPYGKGGSMAISIMNHLTKHGAKAICFLNPICVGNKHFTQKIIDSNLHIRETSEFELGKHFRYPNAADKDLTSPNPVRCQFQIWERLDYHRTKVIESRSNEIIEILHVPAYKVKDGSASKELSMGDRPDFDDWKSNIDFTITSHGPKAGCVIDFDPLHKCNVKMFVSVNDGYDVTKVRSFLESIELTSLTKWSTILHNPSIAPSELIEFVNDKLKSVDINDLV